MPYFKWDSSADARKRLLLSLWSLLHLALRGMRGRSVELQSRAIGKEGVRSVQGQTDCRTLWKAKDRMQIDKAAATTRHVWMLYCGDSRIDNSSKILFKINISIKWVLNLWTETGLKLFSFYKIKTNFRSWSMLYIFVVILWFHVFCQFLKCFK